MLGTLKGRMAVILLVLGVAAWYLYDNGIKLGLDLQGGTHLVLEVDDPQGTMTAEARSAAAERAEKIIRTRIDQFGVAEPLIQRAGDDRIIVELAGIQDEERAKQIIQQTAFLEFKLVRTTSDLADALGRIDRAILAELGEDGLPERAAPEEQDRTGDDVRDILFGRDTVPEAGQAEDAAAVGAESEEDQEPAPPAEPERRPFTALLLQSQSDGVYLVAEPDVEIAQGYLELPSVQRAMPRDIQLHWGSEAIGQGAQLYREVWVLQRDAIMTGEALENATATIEAQYNKTLVLFELNRRGGRVFERFTSQHIGDRMAIILDGEVYSAPVIQARIGTNGQIDLGNAPLAEAQDLALVLRAGALPTPLRIMEERTVGPSLGQDSIDAGMMAGIVGLILVVLVVGFYYRVAGLLAIAALCVYVLLVLGGLSSLGAALTLPGIAGLILSIGMAVDANVLIFERIREEIDAGRTPRTAVDEGFSHAMSAIVDSNLTTLLTALILFQFGTGPVQGFATTLSIGIIASFFSAVYVTRSFFLLYMERRRATQKISI